MTYCPWQFLVSLWRRVLFCLEYRKTTSAMQCIAYKYHGTTSPEPKNKYKFDSDYLRFFSWKIWFHWGEPIEYMGHFKLSTRLFCISVYFELADLRLCLFLKWSPFCCFASCWKPANIVDAQDVRSSLTSGQIPMLCHLDWNISRKLQYTI